MAKNVSDIKEELHDIISFPKNITRQAISHARQGISPLLFKELFNISVDCFYDNLPKRKTWNGLHVFAIDGSKLELPSTKDLFEHFGELFNVHTEKIRNAKKGATVKIETSKWISFHRMVMEALAERPDVTLEISFLDGGHKGNCCYVTIPNGTDAMSLVDKNGFIGFMYLGNKFGLKSN